MSKLIFSDTIFLILFYARHNWTLFQLPPYLQRLLTLLPSSSSRVVTLTSCDTVSEENYCFESEVEFGPLTFGGSLKQGERSVTTPPPPPPLSTVLFISQSAAQLTVSNLVLLGRGVCEVVLHSRGTMFLPWQGYGAVFVRWARWAEKHLEMICH